jgi:hypothetical protein
VATSSRKLYALTPDGTLAFSVPLAGVALDPLRWSRDGELLVTTREGVFYAITKGGFLRAAVALKQPLTTPPLPLEAGRWLVGGARGDVFTLDGWRVSRARLASSPVLALVARGTGYVGLSAEGVFWPGQSPKQPAEQLGCGPDRVIVVAPDGSIGWLEGVGQSALGAAAADTSVLWSSEVNEPLSAAPVCSRDGRVLLPLASGALAVLPPDRRPVSPQGSGRKHESRMRRYALGSSALFTPALDEDRGQVVLTSADGRIQALPLETL